jgi:hypothetical protein
MVSKIHRYIRKLVFLSDRLQDIRFHHFIIDLPSLTNSVPEGEVIPRRDLDRQQGRGDSIKDDDNIREFKGICTFVLIGLLIMRDLMNSTRFLPSTVMGWL